MKYFILLILSLLLSPLFIFALAPHALFTSHNAGFFSCFHVVIGLLDSYEKGMYSGVTVDFGTSGLYYDEKYGNNWWNYYFKPISLDSPLPEKFILDIETIGVSAHKACFFLPRERCKYIIDKYIDPNPTIKKIVSTFIAKQFHNKKFIAVQYRGTDKFGSESSFISPEVACEQIEQVIKNRKLTKKLIFVATDTEQFMTLMKMKFGKKIITYAANRSIDGSPVHLRNDISGYQKGVEALVDCLILSQSAFLIRTASNLSTTALLFNPQLKSICLNTSSGNQDR